MKLLSILDFDEVRVRRPRRQVFLCGGRLDQVPDVACSVREALLRSLPARNAIGPAEIILAERANEALAASSFDNLLDLERCLAAVVDAIILIVESAGSQCELGAFVVVEEIRHKLTVITLNQYYNEPSFIRLGAIKFLEGNSDSAEVHPFDWQGVDGGVAVPDYALQGMITEIIARIEKVPSKQKFNKKSVGHIILLTLSFCHLLRSAKLGDIKVCFDVVAPEIALTEINIRNYLDTLIICGLIDRAANGAKNVYYVSLVDRIPLDAAFTADAKDTERNILRWIETITEQIAEEDSIRLKLFREHNHAA